MENAVDQNQEQDKKKRLILFIIIGVLGAFSLVAGFKAFVSDGQKIEQLEATNTKEKNRAEKLQGEMDKVSSLLESIGFEGDEAVGEFKEEHLKLKEEAEKQKAKLLDLQKKMQELIALSEGDAQDLETFKSAYSKLRAEQWKLKNEVNKLRKRNKQLVAQNRKLKKKNKELTTEVDEQKRQNEMMVEERDILRRQVRKAAILNVQDLNAEGIRVVRGGREKTSKKARKAEKIRVGFTLPKNDVAQAGKKTVYMVITGPDKMPMTDGGSNFKLDGRNMAYTVKKEFDYKNEAKDLMMYGKNLFKDKFDKGTYKIELYCEGAKIGTTELFLK